MWHFLFPTSGLYAYANFETFLLIHLQERTLILTRQKKVKKLQEYTKKRERPLQKENKFH